MAQPTSLIPVTSPAAQRAGDQDRTACTAQLTDGFAAGRLSEVEHGERVERALAAVTTAELADLVRDLPDPCPRVSGMPAVVEHPPGPQLRATLWALLFQFVLVLAAYGCGVDLESDVHSASFITFGIWAVGTVAGAAGVFLGRSLARPGPSTGPRSRGR